jgi:hypothetical protein
LTLYPTYQQGENRLEAHSISVSISGLVPNTVPRTCSASGSGRWHAHLTGDLGLDGFTAGAAWWFTPRVSIAATFDGLWDTSTIAVFELTHTRQVSAKSKLLNYLFGPRVVFAGAVKRNIRLTPFGELQFGLTHLNSTLHEVTASDPSTSDTAFTWMLGGGADYKLNPHWVARINLDLERTHLAEAGQSRLRVGLGVAYTFGQR